MPLHDWTQTAGWEGVRHLWITELLRAVKPLLPAGYRAYIGSPPALAIGAPAEKPDVSVRHWPEETSGSPVAAAASSIEEPDEEVAVATLDPGTSLFVESRGCLVAALELISPRNKDRQVARAAYLARYAGYLMEGVHLLLVDVHPRPLGFSFPDRIAQELQVRQPPCPPPVAVSYRVGGPAATGGRLLAIWRRPLIVGQLLPSAVLPITIELTIPVDVETTYQRAAQDAYLA
ncbi:MAG TPA: DUF4058 family protein [Gemmataceae bacterium]|nr:DUF4058 family protein [Gemmataceae bacterium]